MSGRTVFYEIVSQRNGAVSATVKMQTGRVFRSGGFETYAEVAHWLEGLQALMAACGAPLVQIGEAVDGTPGGTESQQKARAGLEFIPENGGGAGAYAPGEGMPPG